MNWKRPNVTLLAVLAALATGLLISACDNDISRPPPPPLARNLDIFVLNGLEEVELNVPIAIGGNVIGPAGDSLSGIRVYFSVSPNIHSISPITYALTDPTEADGFAGSVNFVGRETGTAIITGSVRDDLDNVIDTDRDTLIVRPPING